MKFREAKEDDWKIINQIFIKNWKQNSDLETSSNLKDAFYKRSHPFNFWVVENEKGVILGWCSCFRVFESPLREGFNADLSIYVDPNSFAMGVGDLLMKETLAILKKTDIMLVFGHIESHNMKSKKLAQKYGFYYSTVRYKNSLFYKSVELWLLNL